MKGSLQDATSPNSNSYGVIFDDGTLSKSTITGFNVVVDLVRRKGKKGEERGRKGKKGEGRKGGERKEIFH